MDSRLKSDSKAVDFYKRYTPKISLDRQAEYTLNAKVLNAMMSLEASMRDSQGKCGFQDNKMIREQVVALCESLRERYQHTLPKARLMESMPLIRSMVTRRLSMAMPVTSPPARLVRRKADCC